MSSAQYPYPEGLLCCYFVVVVFFLSVQNTIFVMIFCNSSFNVNRLSILNIMPNLWPIVRVPIYRLINCHIAYIKRRDSRIAIMLGRSLNELCFTLCAYGFIYTQNAYQSLDTIKVFISLRKIQHIF